MGFSKDILEDWVLSNIEKFDHKLVGDPANGTRRISGQLFSPPDTVMASGTNSSSETELPSARPDLQAFEFICFTAKTSEKLLKKWTSDDELSFRQVIEAHIDQFCDDTTKDWHATMKELGISEARQERIMDPHFNDVRCTAPLLYWILELVLESLWTIENLSERLNRNLLALQSGQKSFSSLRGGAPEDRSKYELTRAGHTTLYRSTSAAKLANNFRSQNLRLDRMCSRPVVPSDFSLDRVAYYWSTQRRVTERFAAYTSHIIQAPDNVCIIRALVPQGLLEGKSVWKLDFGDAWKKLVWHSRNFEPYPLDIQEKWDQSKLIIGPVSINDNWSFHQMKSWRDVSEFNAWRVGGEITTQHVWVRVAAMAAMNEPLEDKWDVFRGHWLLCRKNPTADCKARHIPEPEKWAKKDHLAWN